MNRLNDNALDLIFRKARTYSAWLEKPVSDEILHELYDLMKWGPTSANSGPARILFLRSPQAKKRLQPALSTGNLEKTMSAPVTAVIGYDMQFYDQLPRLFPHADARSWFAGNPELITNTALRNSALQGAYFMIAARSLGLDCGPMSGFDAEKVDLEFFNGENNTELGYAPFYSGKIKTNFLCNIGYGNSEKLHERHPRMDFDEVCRIL